MFEQIARAETWMRTNGPLLREQLDEFLLNVERIADAAEKLTVLLAPPYDTIELDAREVIEEPERANES